MAVGARRAPFETLAHAAARIVGETDLRAALQILAEATAEAADADLVVIRLVDAGGGLVARAVAPDGSALAAEVAGSRAEGAGEGADRLSEPTRRAADRARAAAVLAVPAEDATRRVGLVELVRLAGELHSDARGIAEFAATQAALVTRALGDGGGTHGRSWVRLLELAGEALAAGGETERAWAGTVRVAVETTGARSGLLWKAVGERLELAATEGDRDVEPAHARELALEAVELWRPVALVDDEAFGGSAVTLVLGQPPLAVLQLVYERELAPSEDELPALTAFAARATHALRVAERAVELANELERTRALVEVGSEAISRLSLAHALETAVERTAELLRIDELGVYLRDEDVLTAAAGRGLVEGHEAVADAALDLALGALRARTAIVVELGGDESALLPARNALADVGRTAVIAVPLRVRGEPIGLLVAYPARRLADGDVQLLASLAALLAVAVQNARLHEHATELGAALGAALTSERQAGSQLRALYDISRAFTQSLSLETTLDAVTKTIVEVLDVDAAVLRGPDERGDVFVPQSVHIADPRLEQAVRTILDRPQPRPSRLGIPMLLGAGLAARLGGGHALLVPFLEQGSTAALLPIATSGELLAQLTILSLDPAAPIDEELLATAGTIARQAALAIDNARLYSQQKAFAETMQQSLLPRQRPVLPGFEIGTVYEPAAKVAVGGDVFDFLELVDGRLAVVLGDVTGHGIDATADMAMAKFVFRSLAREHSEPSAFLTHANEVVVSEIAVGKFITMAYLTLGFDGEVCCASAGHPVPRIVRADGAVEPLDCGGLALGVDADQTYQQVRAELGEGDAAVLYTDGVIEARRGRELFGTGRLDEVLAEGRGLPAQALADAVVAACRSFSGGELADDCAIVAIKRTVSKGTVSKGTAAGTRAT
jgi:serine phosphatase RsbU (regulator of sigma subunit)